MKIIRTYPEYKQKLYLEERLKEDDFKTFEEMIADVDLMSNYQKWKEGINYKTNRKIKIGGRIHNKIDYFKYRWLYIDDFIKINKVEYLKEVIEYEKDIAKKNDEIQKYNDIVKSIIDKIISFQKWDDYVEFEGKYYGSVMTVKNDIHIYNYCYGKMKYIETKRDVVIRDRPFCYTEDTYYEYDVYCCSNCNFINKCNYNK
jgi:hypothetical protein